MGPWEEGGREREVWRYASSAGESWEEEEAEEAWIAADVGAIVLGGFECVGI